ncbi:MAG: class I SAM-dependent methyltransferase [Vicinamibacteria bacterium]|nr:class I SAM-dependent methyltransferase [Vicinamibacteria bacterium]
MSTGLMVPGPHEAWIPDLTDEMSRDAVAATRRLVAHLGEARRGPDTNWDQTVSTLRSSPLLAAIHEDPFTRRAYEKPRGYAGDAVLLDHVYGTWQDAPATTVGAAVNRLVLSRPALRAVRFRRQWLAEMIDEACAEGQGACRVLALSCGHLRELELSASVRRGDLVEVVGLDHDTATLLVAREVARKLACRLDSHVASIAAVIKRSLTLMGFDLVYAGDLFDYLEDNVAAVLLQRMLEAARPGGRVVIANFVPDIPDAGFMEACMDWYLVHRSESQLRFLHRTLPTELRGEVQTFQDPDRNIAFLVATRP